MTLRTNYPLGCFEPVCPLLHTMLASWALAILGCVSILGSEQAAKAETRTYFLFAHGTLPAGGQESWISRLPQGQAEFLIDVRRKDRLSQGVRGVFEVIRGEAEAKKAAVIAEQINRTDAGGRQAVTVQVDREVPFVGLLVNRTAVPIDFWIFVLSPMSVPIPPIFGETNPLLFHPSQPGTGTLSPWGVAYLRFRAPKEKGLLLLDLRHDQRDSGALQTGVELLGPHGEPTAIKPFLVNSSDRELRTGLETEYAEPVYVVVAVRNLTNTSLRYALTYTLSRTAFPPFLGEQKPEPINPTDGLIVTLASGESRFLQAPAAPSGAKITLTALGPHPFKTAGRLEILDGTGVAVPGSLLALEAAESDRSKSLDVAGQDGPSAEARTIYVRIINMGKDESRFQVLVEPHKPEERRSKRSVTGSMIK